MKFYLCEICGNLVDLINVGRGQLVCCGEPMKELIPKTNEEGDEKHLPVVTMNSNKLNVKVGSVPHPMTEEHYIDWICIHYNNKVKRAKLNHTDNPEASFDISEDFDVLEVYSYCNVHGLWKTEYRNK
ncbi:MAG TPA: desulfoferrodoxin family protein [Bacilli bacterium]|nr:desulfoferrodoxin family protein [Bacilli bacterium]